MLLKGIPRTTSWASPLPFWALIAAIGTEKYCFRFCHCNFPLISRQNGVAFLYYSKGRQPRQGRFDAVVVPMTQTSFF